ncbi:MAG: 5'/3'-nucleotidase SurE [Dehalococcoidia bacterium]|nr:5'/3'-nucleotidase SurE [Dehalococcoidia bacterium]
MKILVTNDDGIYARGLWALAESLSQVAEVTVCAPDREQSGVGTAVSLHTPVRVSTIVPQVPGITTYAVEGTPGDSVILALESLMPGGVDMVVSGINEGANLGNDIAVSGTLGAAFQAYFRGVPAIAMSVTSLHDVNFEPAAKLARLLAVKAASGGLPRPLLLNVNLPNLPLEKLEGVSATRLGTRSYVDIIQEGYDGKRRWYWIRRGKPEWATEDGSDIWAIRQNRVSITPLHTNLTVTEQASAMEQLCPSLLLGMRYEG